MSVSKRVRYEVLRRDNNTCRYCHATDSPLTVDHVVPTALGGSDDPSNLVAACRDCNAGKTSTSPDGLLVAQVNDDAIRWAQAMQHAADLAVSQLDEEAIYTSEFDEFWSTWSYSENQPIPRPIDWRTSLTRWRVAGMPVSLVLDCAEKALTNTKVHPDSTWRYFCGITWSRLTELQRTAQHAITPQAPVALGEFCGHCAGCLSRAADPDPDPDFYCHTYAVREPDEDPDVCEVCGEAQCVPGQARSAALLDGYDTGSQHEWSRWYDSYERMQFAALVLAVDGVTRYGRVI